MENETLERRVAELEDRVNSLEATLEELKQKLAWLEYRVRATPTLSY